jgi:crotonobetainyl-CoA:carnitine CoA-transferase CaiB-like acyl-CoA transferase
MTVNPELQNASADGLPEKATALAGVRICDLGGILAGAGATRIFAALGAQVIRVEDPVKKGRWDIVRGAGPFVDDRRGNDLGGTFNNHNVEKLGVTINLRQPEGKELFRRLVAISDVVTENFSAGVMDRLGFGYEQLRELNERIIYVANSGFGKTGPYAKFKSFGPIVQAVSGLTFTSALPGQPPAGWGFSYMDHMGANFMALAILGALVRRNRSGQGASIDMSCTDAGLALAGPELLDFTVNGRPARASGSVNSNADNMPAMAPHGIYPSAAEDTWVAIACRDDQDWARLAAAIGEEWAADKRLAGLDRRLAEREDVDKSVAAWTVQRPAEEVRDAVRRAGVPCAKVASPPDRVDEDPATARWGLWPTVRHTEIGDVRVDGMPMHLSETDWVIARGAPCLGEHNRFVFGELLGLSDAELERHVAAGVI